MWETKKKKKKKKKRKTFVLLVGCVGFKSKQGYPTT